MSERQSAENDRPRLVITAGQRYYHWVRQNAAANDDQTRYMVEAYRDEAEQAQPFIEGYYRLLAEDEGTWADWARKLADALEYVLNNPKGGYEQADAYIRAQGVGATVLAEYRAHIDGTGGEIT